MVFGRQYSDFHIFIDIDSIDEWSTTLTEDVHSHDISRVIRHQTIAIRNLEEEVRRMRAEGYSQCLQNGRFTKARDYDSSSELHPRYIVNGGSR